MASSAVIEPKVIVPRQTSQTSMSDAPSRLRRGCCGRLASSSRASLDILLACGAVADADARFVGAPHYGGFQRTTSDDAVTRATYGDGPFRKPTLETGQCSVTAFSNA